MTAASSGSTAADTPVVGPRPQLLTVAAILLGVSAVLAMLFPVSQLTDKTFYGCQVAVASANATPTATSSATPSPSPSSTATTAAEQQAQFKSCVKGQGDIAPASASTVSGDAGRLLLQGVIPLVILAGLAFFAFRGVPLVRWFTVGAWILGGVIGIIPLGPLQAYGVIQQSFPAVTIVVVVLGSIAFTAAAVLMNWPVVVRYFNSRRPVRAAGRGVGAARVAGQGQGSGGLFGSLFGPRPARGGRTPASGPTSSSATGSTVSMDKPAAGGSTPASTRPVKSKGGGSGNTGRAKGKKRG